MTDNEVLQKLLPLIGEVTGVPDDQIRWDSVLMSDLGAESLDLLDLSFLVEEQFGILLEAERAWHRPRSAWAVFPMSRMAC